MPKALKTNLIIRNNTERLTFWFKVRHSASCARYEVAALASLAALNSQRAADPARAFTAPNCEKTSIAEPRWLWDSPA